MENSENISIEQTRRPDHTKILHVAISAVLSFILGFALGFFLSPEKTLEIEKEVVVEKIIEKDRFVDVDGNNLLADFSADYHQVGENFILTEECGYPCTYALKNKEGELLELLNTAFVEWWDDKDKSQLLDIEYISRQGNFIYFKTGIPNSGGCCGLVVYDTQNKQFEDVDLYRGVLSSIVTERGFLVVADLDGKGITVYDMDRFDFSSNTFYEVSRTKISNGTTITGCPSFFEDVYSIYNTEQGSIFYGVHTENGSCEEEALEYKTLPIPLR